MNDHFHGPKSQNFRVMPLDIVTYQWLLLACLLISKEDTVSKTKITDSIQAASAAAMVSFETKASGASASDVCARRQASISALSCNLILMGISIHLTIILNHRAALDYFPEHPSSITLATEYLLDKSVKTQMPCAIVAIPLVKETIICGLKRSHSSSRYLLHLTNAYV